MVRPLVIKTAFFVIIAMMACLFVVPESSSCFAGGGEVVGGSCGGELLSSVITWNVLEDHLAVSVKKLIVLAVATVLTIALVSRGLGTPPLLLYIRSLVDRFIRSGPAKYRVSLAYSMSPHGG